MRIGDYFDPQGYDVLATIQTDHGSVQLLDDSSTSYLLVLQEDESMTDGETTGNVRLHALFDHDGRDAWQVQIVALTRMVDLFAEQTGPVRLAHHGRGAVRS